jgi:hypothetical protein
MSHVRGRGEKVRKYIIENVDKFPKEISKKTAEHFRITRQAVNKHLRRLTDDKFLVEEGETKSRTYKLAPLVEWQKSYPIESGTPEEMRGMREDAAWREDVAPVIGQLPDNVRNIWHHAFTEMFNNALDHSEGTEINVHVTKTAATTEICILDNGVGIFRKIKTALGLLDERHAVLELKKGKFTTDPKNHSGEGIFFTSHMMDEYDILSGDVYFSHEWGKAHDWIAERSDKTHFSTGTAVFMKLGNHTNRTTVKVFDKFTSGEGAFNKTMVPVRVAQYGDDALVSRSQAKRLLARIDRFNIVIFNFEGVKTIGQGFADEIFRVFASRHPEMELGFVGANSEVKRMIFRAKAGQAEQSGGATAELFPDAPKPS